MVGPRIEYLPHARYTADPPRRGFVFAPRYRSWDRTHQRPKADHTEFQRCAQRFCRIYGLPDPYIFDNEGDDGEDQGTRADGSIWRGHLGDDSNLGTRRQEVLRALGAATGPLDVIAYFGHGGPNALLSAGFSRPHIDELARAIAAKAARRVTVLLFACRCGERGGFAQELARRLRRHGRIPTVYGHEQSMHTVANPHKRRYPGGDWVIRPNSEDWGLWHRRLRAWANDDWFARFPFVEPYDISAVLNGEEAGPAGRFTAPG